MQHPQFPLPGRLLSDPQPAWNLWLVLHQFSELLWEHHQPLFGQWARDEFFGGPDLSPRPMEDDPVPPPAPAETGFAAAFPGSPAPGYVSFPDDDVPF